eukprot:1375774-Heterocapsa_arctica.AAC.1
MSARDPAHPRHSRGSSSDMDIAFLHIGSRPITMSVSPNDAVQSIVKEVCGRFGLNRWALVMTHPACPDFNDDLMHIPFNYLPGITDGDDIHLFEYIDIWVHLRAPAPGVHAFITNIAT